MWVKNTKGSPDAMLTFALGGFVVTALSIVISFIDKINYGNVEIVLSSPDATIISAFLGATLLAYVNRRNTKDKFEHEKEMRRLEKDG